MPEHFIQVLRQLLHGIAELLKRAHATWRILPSCWVHVATLWEVEAALVNELVAYAHVGRWCVVRIVALELRHFLWCERTPGTAIVDTLARGVEVRIHDTSDTWISHASVIDVFQLLIRVVMQVCSIFTLERRRT